MNAVYLPIFEPLSRIEHKTADLLFTLEPFLNSVFSRVSEDLTGPLAMLEFWQKYCDGVAELRESCPALMKAQLRLLADAQDLSISLSVCVPSFTRERNMVLIL